MNKINLKIDNLNLPLSSIESSIDIDVADFCQLFAALQSKTLAAPDSVGSWCVITPNSSIKVHKIIKLGETGELMMQLRRSPQSPTAGRWVKLME